jgi:hypothetical protein
MTGRTMVYGAAISGSAATLTARKLGRRRRSPALDAGPLPMPAAEPTVSVIVPALNEEGSIDWVLDHIPSWVSEVVLVDGLSTDETEVVARRMWPDLVVVHQRMRGKGAALRAGFAAARGDIIVMIDADGSTDPREMHLFVDALRDGADFVKGSRSMPGGGSVDFTRLRQAGNQGFVLAANLLFGSDFTDLCYGYCAFWRHHLEALALNANGFEIETQLVLSAVKADLRVVEVPSVELERRAGISNLNVVSDGLRVLRTLLHERIRRQDAATAAAARIQLHAANAAHPGTDGWLPAGSERRRHLHARHYRGAERRRAPRHVAEVLIAAPTEAPTVPGPPRALPYAA